MAIQTLQAGLTAKYIVPLAHKISNPGYSAEQLKMDMFHALLNEHSKERRLLKDKQKGATEFSPEMLKGLWDKFNGLLGQDIARKEDYQNAMKEALLRFAKFQGMFNPEVMGTEIAKSQLQFLLTQQKSKEMDLAKTMADRHKHRVEEDAEEELEEFEAEDKKEHEIFERGLEAEKKFLQETEQHAVLNLSAGAMLADNVNQSFQDLQNVINLKPNPLLDASSAIQPQSDPNNANKLAMAADSMGDSLKQGIENLTQENLQQMKQNYDTMMSSIETLKENGKQLINNQQMDAGARTVANSALDNWYAKAQNYVGQFLSTGQVTPYAAERDQLMSNWQNQMNAQYQQNNQLNQPPLPTHNQASSTNDAAKPPSEASPTAPVTPLQQDNPRPFDAIREGHQELAGTGTPAASPEDPARKSIFSTSPRKPTDAPHP